MKSNTCKVCGVIGEDKCPNEQRHASLIKARIAAKRMKTSSYLYFIANSPRKTGHNLIKKLLSNEVSIILTEKNKAPKSLYFKRKRYA